MVDHDTPVTRRTALTAAALFGALAAQRLLDAAAQDDAPLTVATPAAGIGAIQPTGVGDVPSTGASRPGPADLVRPLTIVDAITPVGLAIETAGIDAGIEALRVVDGAMQDPTGPWVVAWYENLGALGARRQCRDGRAYRLLECGSVGLLQPRRVATRRCDRGVRR